MLFAELISDKRFEMERRDLVAIQNRASWLSYGHGSFELSSLVIVRHNDSTQTFMGIAQVDVGRMFVPPGLTVLSGLDRPSQSNSRKEKRTGQKTRRISVEPKCFAAYIVTKAPITV
jgi:hypothetical protein